MMKAFISCALTHVPRDVFARYASFIHSLAEVAWSAGCNDVKYALISSDPQLARKPESQRARLCYTWDKELVRGADVVIADATYPSIGMGIELEVACGIGIPIIICYEHRAEHRIESIDYDNPDRTRHTLQIGEGYVSLMALGLTTLFKVIPYTSESEALVGVADSLKMLIK
jgi:hypothetical protein